MVLQIDLDGVIFDLGNTLIPFTPKDSMEFVVKWYHAAQLDEKKVPFTEFLEIFRYVVRKERERSRKELWESTVPLRAKMMDEELQKRGFSIENIETSLGATHTGAFSTCLRANSSGRYVLNTLNSAISREGKPVKVGLISNAIDADALRTFLNRESWTDLFDSIIISGDVNMAKPSPEIFRMSLEELDLKPERSIYIGDRYEADILGPTSIGMHSIYIREHHTAGEPPEGITIPTSTITNILDLIPLLEEGSFCR
jgi:FMN phosphatase YigB (HAD superfamily)